MGVFCNPRTSTDPDRFYHLPVNEDHEEQRKISAVDLLTNLIKEKTTSLILIGPYVFVQEAESHAYS